MAGSLQDMSTESGDGAPAAKRMRMLSKACEACKLKKSRCDSSQPRCDSCRRKGLECIYREKGQPGLRPGYGKGIEHRLTLLEEGMEKINRSIQDALNTPRTGLAPPPALSVEQEASGSRNVQDAQLWQTLQQPLEQQLPHPSAESPLQPPPDMEPISFPSLPELDIGGGLPPSEVLQELTDLFFDLVSPWFPLFYKPKFLEGLFLPERQVLLHGLVVIAFRFWRKAGPSVEQREAYVKSSREQILLRSVDTCSLIVTQALALLALDALGDGPGPRTWNIMAMLVAATQQLGLARSSSLASPEITVSMVQNDDPDDGLDASSIEAEEKRRLFWVIYYLDRFSSVSNGQPGGIDTRSIRVRYPSNDKEWGQPVSTQWFQASVPIRSTNSTNTHYASNLWRCYVDLLALLDRSNQILIQPFNLSSPAHCQEWQSNFRQMGLILSTWFESLPGEIREPQSNFDCMWYMIHATFCLINLRMHTVAAFPSATSQYLRPSASARVRCRQDIRSVVQLASRLQQYEVEQLGPSFAFIVWVAARSLMILWTRGYENTYGSIPPDLESLLGVLRRMAPRWKCAQRYADIIQFILDTKNKPDGTTGLNIFNDTRRTAYGLQKRLGTQAVHQAMRDVDWCDFLDMPIFDEGDWITRIGSAVPEVDDEWL